MSNSTYRCTHYAPNEAERCEAYATHALYDDDVKRVPGCVMCEEHGRAVITEYREKAELFWTMVPLDPRGLRIKKLEAESVKLVQIGRDLESAAQEQFDAIECVEMELTQAHKHIAKLEDELARWRRNYPTSAAWEHALLPKEATGD